MKTRREYIDTYYVDGIVNSDGETVIRKLNDYEKEWLNKFYAEHVNASFCEENNLHQILSDEKRQEVKDKVRMLKKEFKDLQKEINELIMKRNGIEDSIEALKSSDHKGQSYAANNARNVCLYNMSKKTGKLVKLNVKEYDEYTSDYLDAYDMEHALLFMDGRLAESNKDDK